MLIKDSKELASICKQIAKAEYIALDTEFMRTDTYFPALSLIQISDGSVTCAVDMLADLDFSPLDKILQNPKIVKVIHSARQDMEVLYNKFGDLPKNVFDTQIACQFLGFQNPPGYEAIINHFLQIKINKKLQFSDWLERPLSQSKLSYALNDVAHLFAAYTNIRDELKVLRRYEWVVEECSYLQRNTDFLNSIAELLYKFQNHFHREEQFAKCLALLRWREQIAIARNMIRRRVLTDEAIVLLVKKHVFPRYVKKYLSEDEFIELKSKVDSFVPTVLDQKLIAEALKQKAYRSLPKGDIFRMLQELLSVISIRENIAASIIASSDEIAKLACHKDENIRCLSGWRFEVFGREAIEFRNGKVSALPINMPTRKNLQKA